jgi:NTE family protein
MATTSAHDTGTATRSLAPTGDPMDSHMPRIGLALGGGSARGWAHIGVIAALEEIGIHADLIAGTSIGALVGAAHAGEQLAPFEDWARSLSRKDVFSLLDFQLGGGMIKGTRLMDFFRSHFHDSQIEDLALPFGATATVLQTGAEVWLRSGSTLDAVRASLALPALLTPVQHQGRLLVDGGLVNPVPVSLARAMEADLVIAVELASDFGRSLRPPPNVEPTRSSPDWLRRIQSSVSSLLPASAAATPAPLSLPSMLTVLSTSIDIMQTRISRSRMAGDPPDIILRPRVAQIGILDFHRAAEAIEAGRRAVLDATPALQACVAAAQTRQGM